MSTTEFPRPWKADAVLTGEAEVEIVAEAAERSLVAHRLGVAHIAELACRFRLSRVPGEFGRLDARCVLRARLTRECVVTLDPFEEELNEDFQVVFVPEGALSEEDDPESVDEVPYQGATIDLGEAAVEQLALSMAPYPRKPGAEALADTQAGPVSPFAGLARLKAPH